MGSITRKMRASSRITCCADMHLYRPKGISLLWRILLSTSMAVAVLFALIGWMVQSYAGRVSQRNLEQSARASLHAYQTLGAARAETFMAVSRIIGSMSDVRAAFMTGDRATIRDTAEQLWSQVSEQDAVFLVLDPTGKVIASLGGDYPNLAITRAQFIGAIKRFPKQVAGYIVRGSHLYYVVLTPVYVQSAHGSALLNVLLVALEIDNERAHTLKTSTNGSDFAFLAGGKIVAATLPHLTAADLRSSNNTKDGVQRLLLHGTEYLLLGIKLEDIEGHSIGALYIIRSFAAPRHALAELQRNVAIIWLIALMVGIGLTYLLARRILKPVKDLDRAAEEVIKQNYDYRIPVKTDDELGRLAKTFNAMCDSIRTARQDLIRQERIATIGRFASSVVHDLRSPLAAIYGGAEMLVDTHLSPEQSKRLAGNMYRASRRIQELLQDLVDVVRAKATQKETCKLEEVIKSAGELVANQAHSSSVSVMFNIPDDLEVAIERNRVERVFVNLMNNALDAMPNGGELCVTASRDGAGIITRIQDTGPGLSEEAWSTLFEPFATSGKKSGLGLGLALSRQTILDHGGDLWAQKNTGFGALFYLRLPAAASSASPSEEHDRIAALRGAPNE